jgi:3-hydroxy-D-aspartate aldolase
MTINIPATVGMAIEDVDTPCLRLELNAFERNVAKMAKFVKGRGTALGARQDP